MAYFENSFRLSMCRLIHIFILAFSSTISILLDDSQLQKPIASIFEIREYSGDKGIGADAIFTEDKIVVIAQVLLNEGIAPNILENLFKIGRQSFFGKTITHNILPNVGIG